MFPRLRKDARHSARTVLHNHAFAIEQIAPDLCYGARMLGVFHFASRGAAQRVRRASNWTSRVGDFQNADAPSEIHE
jgi:hypothetical protein